MQIEEVSTHLNCLACPSELRLQKANLILACATYRLDHSEIFGLSDLPDANVQKCTRFSLLELHVGDQFSVRPTWFESLGDWQVDGFPNVCDIVRNEVDGKSLLY